uniref:VWFA and cache domain-containing protein 1-like n=1 Tax=Saccoglossus kowalevskii TaxID=10224 RepID=A0ABM0M6Z1_SACKO|nr:PREDICTED: VWFA and cache domain-containing protein 1-like [Saccoglossus kowalevskii]
MLSAERGVCILFTMLIALTTHCNGTILDTEKLRNELFNLAYSGLGVQKMQDHFDSLRFGPLSLAGDDVIEQMELAIRQKIVSTVKAIENIRESVEKSFEQTEIAFTPCCEIPNDLEFNTAFGKSLDPRIGCTRIADNADPNPRFLSNEVIDVMKENYNSFSNLKWQYFGSEEGIFTIYPASLIDDCANYDHRFRPWYVEAATPEPKNVVIVIDTSGSMANLHSGKSLINIAIDAAITVLDTMNPNDKVGVIAFSDELKLPPKIGDASCYANELALATTINIQNLKQFVLSLVARGGTHYGKAFDAAFNLLKESYTLDADNERDQVIIFLTDGEPLDDKTSIMRKIRSNNEEMENKVTILTFGLGLDSGINFLEDIAVQNYVNHGLDAPGVFTHVTDYTLLRSKMARYYDYFANFDRLTDEPIFSVPYQDGFGLGMMTTAAIPVKYANELKGVIGVDITLSDLLEDVTFFTGGDNSYAFVFEANTYANGRTLLHPLLPSPLVIKDEPVIGSNYVVCFVEAVGDYKVELLEQSSPANNQSTVKFAPRAFISPAEYLKYEETESIIEQYQDYMKDASFINTHFKDGIRDAVLITAAVNDIWKSDDATGYEHYTLFRYMGTRNGVYRQLPGISMSKLHDTTIRPWYERAKHNADILTLSVPYVDANGAGEVIALSKAITESISSPTSTNVLAVMGMDFTISYFYNMLIKHYPECEEIGNSCFVMDSSGFLVIHRDFTEADSDVSDIHIMEKEPNVAEDLLEKGILQKQQCVDFQMIKNLNYYMTRHVGSTSSIDNMDDTDVCKRYKLAHVQDTNVYLGIVRKLNRCNRYCPCYYADCQYTALERECECPCLSLTEYEYCKDQFSFTSDDEPTCLPPRPSLSLVIEETSRYRGLDQCYDVECDVKQTASECNAYVSCKWNREDEACADMFSAVDDDVSNTLRTAVIVTVVALVLCVLVAIILVVKFRHKGNINEPNTMDNYPQRPIPPSAPVPSTTYATPDYITIIND